MNNLYRSLLLSVKVSLAYLFIAPPITAQIYPDSSIPTQVRNSLNLLEITGGATAGANLFHSFSDFSVPTGTTAYFNNPLTIQNIITRVTGTSVSNIDGLIKTNGTTNLFLLNPNGIIFGENANLNIAGSFFATTANSIEFSDRTIFTTNPNTPAILTISTPFGLGFGSTPGTIINQSKFVVPGIPTPVGLAVPPGKTLALIGGDIFLNGGVITASGGRIQLGSVQSPSQVYLTPDAEGWAIDYRDVPNFGNIQLSQAAEVSTSGARGGEIIVQAAKLRLTERSHLTSVTEGAESGREITINATDSVEIMGDGRFFDEIYKFASGNFILSNSPTGLFSFSIGAGSAGNIVINTNSFSGQNSAFVLTSTLGAGNGGNLTLNATNSVELNAANLFTGTGTAATGNAGRLTINTKYFQLSNNGFASTSNLGESQAGNININATESLEIIGKNRVILPNGQTLIAGIFTSSFGSKDAANLDVATKRLVIQNGGNINADSPGSGGGGNITVNASESIKLSGQTVDNSWHSSITASGNTQGGDIKIKTENLEINNTANISASGTLRGGNLEINANHINLNNQGFMSVISDVQAGKLQINTNSLNLDNQAIVSATSRSGEGGNIQIKTLGLQLRHNSEISTTAGLISGTGNGGNININTDTLVALENSKIAANAFEGNGGNITIQAQGNFLSSDSTLSASSELGVNGIVEVNTPLVDPSSGLTQLPSTPVSVSKLVAQTCSTVGRKESRLALTGRGGLPPNPTEPFNGEAVVVDLGFIHADSAFPSVSLQPLKSNFQPRLVEAQGWLVNQHGEVVLLAESPDITPHHGWQVASRCN